MIYGSFTKAFMAYMGMTPAELLKEWKPLSDEDKAFFKVELAKIDGYEWQEAA